MCIYICTERQTYIYMVKNVYIDITVHVHVCAFLYKMYIYFRYKRTTAEVHTLPVHTKVYALLAEVHTLPPKVHTLWAESAYTLAQKCMSF